METGTPFNRTISRIHLQLKLYTEFVTLIKMKCVIPLCLSTTTRSVSHFLSEPNMLLTKSTVTCFYFHSKTSKGCNNSTGRLNIPPRILPYPSSCLTTNIVGNIIIIHLRVSQVCCKPRRVRLSKMPFISVVNTYNLPKNLNLLFPEVFVS